MTYPNFGSPIMTQDQLVELIKIQQQFDQQKQANFLQNLQSNTYSFTQPGTNNQVTGYISPGSTLTIGGKTVTNEDLQNGNFGMAHNCNYSQTCVNGKCTTRQWNSET